MVKTQQGQHRSLYIVNVRPLANARIANIVRLSVGNTGLDTAASHPHREGFAVVVAA
jgi:hypothetical protein